MVRRGLFRWGWLILGIVVIGAGRVPVQAGTPAQSWPESTPEAQGVDSDLLADMLEYIQAEDLQIRGVVIARNGVLVAQAYRYPYTEDTLHELRSCTKSITSALVGIAIDQGAIAGIDAPVLGFFPDRTIANVDENKQALQLKHLLTMTAGFNWPDDAQQTTSEMTASPDWVQFVLDRPMRAKPGTRFNYNNGVTHLLGAILQQATGVSLLDYAQASLFDPLGMPGVGWATDPTGLPIGAWGLSLRPRDMAKFGQLYLSEGVWDEQQVVPAAWIADSTRDHLNVGDIGYGYQWWIHTDVGYYTAEGSGGQYIIVRPHYNMVVVFTSGFRPDRFSVPQYLLDTYILPAAESGQPLPENPDGVARLSAAKEALEHPQPAPVPALPALASAVSGRTYDLDPNPFNWQSFVLTFEPGADTAILHVNGFQDLPLGLDGMVRVTETDEDTLALRAAWTGPNRLMIELFPVGIVERWQLELTFADEVVEVRVQELIGEYTERFFGIQRGM